MAFTGGMEVPSSLKCFCPISVLCVIIVSLLTSPVSAQCTVRLDVVNTTLAFSGSSAASLIPGAFPVALKDPETEIGLAGPMYLTLDGKCPPSTGSAWLAAAGSIRIASAPSPYHYKPLLVYPDALHLAVMGVPLNISNLALNLSMAGVAPSTTNPIKLAVDGTITDGYVFSDTVVTGGPQLQPMTQPQSVSTSSAAISLTEDGPNTYLDITVNDCNLTFVGKTSGVVSGKPWNGTMTFSLAGPLKLTGLLGCPRDCGDFGRCVPVNNVTASAAAGTNSSAAATFACECECGWAVDNSTGRCEVPSGTCPIYGSDSSSSRSLSLMNGTSSSCSGGKGGSVMASAGACPTTYGYDVFTKTCSKCEADWSGPGCKMCTTDKACQAKLSKPNAICNTGLLYNERSSEKYYSCALNDASIARIIGPVLPLTCKTAGDAKDNKGASSALAVNEASLLGSQATCSIAMRLVGMPAGSSAMCTATGCHFTAGNPSFKCDGVACDCPNGCPPNYLQTFRDISGVVTLDCDTTGQDCTIVIGSLNMKISASCEASECLDPSGPKLVGTQQQQEAAPPIAPPLVAALPLLLLVLGGLACGLALTRYKSFLRSGTGSRLRGSSTGSGGGSDAVATAAVPLVGATAAVTAGKGMGVTSGPSSTPKGVTRGAGIGHIHQLTFSDITADVKVHRTWKEFVSTPLQRRRQQQQQQQQAAGFSGQEAAKELGPAGAGSADPATAAHDLERGDDNVTAATSGSNAVGSSDSTIAANTTTGAAARASSSDGSGSSGDRWRPVLCGVSGCVASGQVLGIMGPSGGGKSTLLLKLCGSLGAAGRGSDWRSGGLVCLDGVAAPPSLLTAVTALVPQDDALMRSLTVEECIRYSAALRLEPSLPASEVGARVEGVMATLGLSHIRGSTVLSGTGVSGVSGGERRRVGIAMELVIDPQVLVLDEPLSGLDSFTALQLMKTLKAVAASGRVVALSLHQPSPAIFNSLDSAMLLAAGLLVYSGPPAAAEAALVRLGCPVPKGITVAEHMLHAVSDPESLQAVVAATLRQQRQQGLAGVPLLSGQGQHARSASNDSNSADQAAWSLASIVAPGSEQQPTAQQVSAAGLLLPNNNNGRSSHSGNKGGRSSHSGNAAAKSWATLKAAAGTFSPRASASGQARVALGLPGQKRPLSRQVGVLFWRGLLDMLRNPLLTAFHSLGGLLLGLLVGIIFFSVKNDTSGAQNRVGALFFALCLLAFTSVTSVDLVQAESGAAGREMQRKYYSPVAYALTKLVLDGLLLRALPALLFALPFYFLMGLNPAALQFFVFLLTLIAFSAAVGALALGFASALNSPGKTILVMNLVLLLGVLFGGFLANKASIPAWLRWISWLSVFRYAWEALVINELSGIDLFLSAPGVSLSLPVKGEVFLEIIGVQARLFMVDIAVLVGMYVAACVFVVVVVAWRNRQRKH